MAAGTVVSMRGRIFKVLMSFYIFFQSLPLPNVSTVIPYGGPVDGAPTLVILWLHLLCMVKIGDGTIFGGGASAG